VCVSSSSLLLVLWLQGQVEGHLLLDPSGPELGKQQGSLLLAMMPSADKVGGKAGLLLFALCLLLWYRWLFG
jgi:hypothetical protein